MLITRSCVLYTVCACMHLHLHVYNEGIYVIVLLCLHPASCLEAFDQSSFPKIVKTSVLAVQNCKFSATALINIYLFGNVSYVQQCGALVAELLFFKPSLCILQGETFLNLGWTKGPTAALFQCSGFGSKHIPCWCYVYMIHTKWLTWILKLNMCISVMD